MTPHRSTIPCALAIAFVGCAGVPEGPFVCAFDAADSGAGAVPIGWETAETNSDGRPGSWRVVDGDGQRYVSLAETSNRRQTYNLLFAPGRFPADLAIAVQLRADAGKEDQGGGVVWRARDADNYYVARWNPLEDNVRAYKVVGGKRIQLASATLQVAPGWHNLRVSMRGANAEVHFGSAVLRFADPTFGGGGRVGLWTKADAATSFDDLRVTPG